MLTCSKSFDVVGDVGVRGRFRKLPIFFNYFLFLKKNRKHLHHLHHLHHRDGDLLDQIGCSWFVLPGPPARVLSPRSCHSLPRSSHRRRVSD